METPREADGAGLAPPCKKPRGELLPDIPLSFSDLPLVVERIRENNAQSRPRKRLKPFDFFNEVFTKLGTAGVHDDAQRACALALLDEGIAKHKVLPRSTSLGHVLYAWNKADNAAALQSDAQRVLDAVLAARETLPTAFGNTFDEKVVTVGVRVAARMQPGSEGIALIQRLLSTLKPELFKRRLFAPIFKLCETSGNVALSTEMLRLGCQHGLEFWDEDYNTLLRGIKQLVVTSTAAADATQAAEGLRVAKEGVEYILQCMVCHHPVVGASNAELLSAILRSVHQVEATYTTVSETTGTCSRCHEKLASFDLSDAERELLSTEIIDKLVQPRLRSQSHYEPEKPVTEEELGRRTARLAGFLKDLAAMEYTVVIDGANVGYYGLSSWYPTAKAALLVSNGIDPASVPSSQLHEVPLPVDVSPKFSIIDDMVTYVRRLGEQPIVVLHERHLERSKSGRNLEVLQKWRAEKVVLASPGFLNDDYCWLYACLKKAHSFVVTNDLMRDHHYSMLSQRCFVRWRQRHRIRYTASFNPATDDTALRVLRPKSYSIWVQMRDSLHATPRAPRGWHIPVLTSTMIIQQATNRTTPLEYDVGKDGDDECDRWLCVDGPPLT